MGSQGQGTFQHVPLDRALEEAAAHAPPGDCCV
jgi:hypothetical protein